MPPPPTPSLFRRTLLYLGLLAGFYALALGLVLGLALLPFALHQLTGRLPLDVGIASLLGILAIGIGIFPQPPGHFDPGPPLTRAHQPRLFRLLDEVARASGQALPDAVHFVHLPTMWVTHSGGRLGWGARRILAIGLPIFAALDESELRAVLAHEFAHFRGGETRLGGVLHRTRSAMGRTLSQLDRAGPAAALLQRPLRAYGRFFLRKTMSISRAQEWEADRIAAGIAGRAALVSGLRKIHVLEAAFDGYLRLEVNPVLSLRALPPIIEGFRSFLAGSLVRERYERDVAGIVEAYRAGVARLPSDAGQYDSHPWLHERVDALAGVPDGEIPAGDGPAYLLLEDVPRLERALVARQVFGAPRFPAVAWDDVGERVMLPLYRYRVRKLADLLRGWTIGDAGARLAERAFPLGVESTKRFAEAATNDPETIAGRGVAALACAVAATLAGRGWRLSCQPGEHLRAIGPEGGLEVLQEMGALDLGRNHPGRWLELCSGLGIADWPLDVGDDAAGEAGEAGTANERGDASDERRPGESPDAAASPPDHAA